jgi:DNA-binding HxlR family transcriptional regulator
VAEPGRKPRAAAPQEMRSEAAARKPHARALDNLIHDRVRLGIVSALAVNDSLSFADLKQQLGVTDGNLSVHARKLEEAGYLKVTKRFEERVPRTEYRLARAGRRALEAYLDHMEGIIRTVRDG